MLTWRGPAARACVFACAGPLQGTVIVSMASTLGAALAFLVSRYVARPFVEERLQGGWWPSGAGEGRVGCGAATKGSRLPGPD